eukprot:TRINITY_DN20574_c0_g1_i1.p1 TRINITY_DN20574_c0_g1~~TRINITY_DN20574_c0_g1_i1.p1  ORF type:complete len:889 (-),score=177.54 TRINITY_DN20574_c0_g1_i1:128-2794(-)
MAALPTVSEQVVTSEMLASRSPKVQKAKISRQRTSQLAAFADENSADDLGATAESMEKLLFEVDETTASEFLQDLISAAGLRSAWGQIAKKIRNISKAHAELMAFASREALNRDYVTRPEYQDMVETKHDIKILENTEFLNSLAQKVELEIEARRKLGQHHKDLSDLFDAEMRVLKPELKSVQDWLTNLDAQCAARHSQTLKGMKKLEEDSRQRDDALHKEMKDLLGELVQEIRDREALAKEVDRIKDFLSGETLRKHIIASVSDALTAYVCKEEMMSQVERATEHLYVPLWDKLERIDKELAETSEELADKDAQLSEALEAASARIERVHEHAHERLDVLTEDVNTRVRKEYVEQVEGKLNLGYRHMEDISERLQLQTTQKVQEVVTRISEFQVILEDHEHALHHQAEEMLNRATKYDFAMHDEKIGKCASKDKTEAELKELRQITTWTSAKIESMASTGSFGGHHNGSRSHRHQATSRNSRSTTQDLTSEAGSVRADSKAISKSGSFLKLAVQAEDDKAEGESHSPSPSVTQHVLLVPTAEDVNEVQPDSSPPLELQDENVFSQMDGGEGKLSEAALGASTEIHNLLQEHAETLEELQEQVDKIEQIQADPLAGASTMLTLLQQQLECLGQALLGLGRAVLRPRTQDAVAQGATGLTGLPRNARQDHSAELLHHISSVLYWISHRQRPAEWCPDHLTSCALRSLPSPGASPNVPSDSAEVPTERVRESVSARLDRLRQNKAATASPRRLPLVTPETPRGGGRAFASGGSGWRHRGIAATGGYKELPQRPATSGPALGAKAASLPQATGTQMRIMPSTAASTVPPLSPAARGVSLRKVANQTPEPPPPQTDAFPEDEGVRIQRNLARSTTPTSNPDEVQAAPAAALQ